MKYDESRVPMEYSSFDRVRTALEHREPDRIPFDIGGAAVTGININALRKLKNQLGMSREVELWDRVTQLARTGDDLVEKLGIDVVNVGPEGPSTPGLSSDLGLVDDHYRIIDEFGIGWQMPKEGGHYYDLYHHPLADAETVADIETYPWPDPLDPARFQGLREKVDRVLFQEKKSYVMGRMSAGMWEHAIWMMGYEKFFMDMVLNKKLIHAIMEKVLELKTKYWGRYLDIVGTNATIVSTADDLGTQNSLLVSLDMYKELIWPYHRRLFEFLKKSAKSRVYIFFHNDGAIMDTIPLLIEAGIDILNPFQVNCKGMDTRKFKKEFGNDLTIWGGSCDPKVLEFGSPEEIREETKRRIDDLAPGGGFIFAPIHIIQGGVPPENIIAWWETHQEFCRY
jgi:uroporphyrinogen decarboxylase